MQGGAAVRSLSGDFTGAPCVMPAKRRQDKIRDKKWMLIISLSICLFAFAFFFFFFPSYLL
jgi:hypothetical protein